MSLQKLEAHLGHPVSPRLKDAINRGALPPALNWQLILQLVQQYGPVALEIIQAILSGTTAPAPPAPPGP